MRKVVYILVYSSFFILHSCMPILKIVTGFRNPEVVSTSDVEAYLKETNLYDGETYYLGVTKEKILKDTSIFSEYINNLKFAFSSDPIVFDSLGNRLLYVGSSSCGGVRLSQLYDSLEYFYFNKENKIENLAEFISRLQNNKGENLESNILPKADYYLIESWSIFFQNKKRTKEDFSFHKRMRASSKYKFHVIYVNTDMQENWGLKNGKRLKINTIGRLKELLSDEWNGNIFEKMQDKDFITRKN